MGVATLEGQRSDVRGFWRFTRAVPGVSWTRTSVIAAASCHEVADD